MMAHVNLWARFEMQWLAFEKRPISFIEEKEVIGFAAAGMYKDGWTGVGETFNDKDAGTCHYVVHNFQITGGPPFWPKNL